MWKIQVSERLNEPRYLKWYFISSKLRFYFTTIGNVTGVIDLQAIRALLHPGQTTDYNQLLTSKCQGWGYWANFLRSVIFVNFQYYEYMRWISHLFLSGVAAAQLRSLLSTKIEHFVYGKISEHAACEQTATVKNNLQIHTIYFNRCIPVYWRKLFIIASLASCRLYNSYCMGDNFSHGGFFIWPLVFICFGKIYCLRSMWTEVPLIWI